MSDPATNGDPSRPVDVSPADAVGEYLEDQQYETADSTHQVDESCLSNLVQWCATQSIDSMHDIRPEHVTAFYAWQRERSDLSTVTPSAELETLRLFLDWCIEQRYCSPSLGNAFPDRAGSPTDKTPDDHLLLEHGDALMEHLKEEYNEPKAHIMYGLFWESGLRMSAVCSLDVDQIQALQTGDR